MRKIGALAGIGFVLVAVTRCGGAAGNGLADGPDAEAADSGAASGDHAMRDSGGAASKDTGPHADAVAAPDAPAAPDAEAEAEPDAEAEAEADAEAEAEADPDAEAEADAGPAAARIVGGYYPNWTPSPVRIRDVDPHYNLIYLFAATPTGGSPGTGALTWTAPGDGLGAATNLVADIAYARSTQGRKIVLSIGGAGEDMSFPDRTTSQTFVSSVASLYTQLGGFDGIDWDTYEGTDSPDTSEMIWISQQLKSMYPGFLITTPPAPWSTVDQTFCSQMAAAGALDYAAPQYYDGPNLATQAYIVPNVQTWAGLLGADKVVVGFGIADATNYMTVAQVISTWSAILPNEPNIRGAFDWEIDVDQAAGWPFAQQVGPLVNP